MNSLFATTAPIGPGHGGGMVSYVECLALKETTELVQVLCPEYKGESRLPIKTLSLNGNYPDNPFMWDYLTANNVKTPVDIAFFNGAPYTITSKVVRGAKIIVDVPAHDLELSIEEFGRLGIEYPFVHMTDPFLWNLYTQFIREADLIICPSKKSADYVKRNPGTKAKVEVIPYGADIPVEVKSIPVEFKVGYLGAVGPDKGLVYLLKAWAGLMLNDSELLLGGMDSVPLGDMLSRTNYRCLGRVEDPAEFYSQCSVFVQPSVTESFGIPTLEAMACSRPVIVTEGAGVSELVKDGAEGFVVPIRDAGAIADRIQWLKDRPEKIAQMGQKAQLKAEKYPWFRAQKEYERIIMEVLQ